MALQILIKVLLAIVVVSAAPFRPRRDLGTAIYQCNHHFAYTWDDGPWIHHTAIGNSFSDVGGKTTFFLNGDNYSCIYEEENVQRMRQSYEAGHMLASHTWSHTDLRTLTNVQIDVEIRRLDEAFIKILGVRPRFIRPPYGGINDAVATYIQQTHGKRIAMWSDDSGDSTGGSAQASYNFYRNFARAGPGQPHLTLSHETSSAGTDSMFNGTVALLANAGITLQTVAECIDEAPYDYIGGYGQRDSSWTCGGTWNPSPTSTTSTISSTSSTSSTSTTSTPAPSCVTTYYSVSGDSCISIGSKYGLTGSAISQANTFINCADIWVGTPVCIPPPGTPCAQSYTSQARDNCANVATQFGVTESQISLWNWWVNCNDVWTGTVLCVKH